MFAIFKSAATPIVITAKSCFLKRPIVTQISSTTSILRSSISDNEIYLLGTAHVSDASSEEVVDLIRLVKPQTVFVELDAKRAAHLMRTDDGSASSSPMDLASMIQNNMSKMPFLFPPGSNNNANNVLPILQSAPDLLKKIGWLPPPGGEMKAALLEAQAIGAKAIYGDVELQQTMRELQSIGMQTLQSFSTSPGELVNSVSNVPPPPPELAAILGDANNGIISMFAPGSSSDPVRLIESIKTREHARLMTKYLSQCFPSVYRVMISQRDVHMASVLKSKCSSGKVVAVVGMAHVEGIEREWEMMDKKQ